MQTLKFNSAIINVTNRCNLKCKYCFVKQNNKDMSLDTAKQIVDLLAVDCEIINKSLSFFGGEPLLKWDDIIVPIINYIEQKEYKIKLNITSNGLLLDESKLQYMQKHDVTLLLSCDGDQYSQDINRVTPENTGSFDLLRDKFELVIKYLPDTILRGTITPATSHLLLHNILFASQLGFKYCYFCPDTLINWDDKSFRDLAQAIRDYALYFLNSYRNNSAPILLIPYIKNFNVLQQYAEYLKNKEYSIPCSMCGIAHNNDTLAFSPDGKIFSCQQMITHGVKNNPYYLGTLKNGINLEKQQQLLQMRTTLDISCENDLVECKKCVLKDLCSSHYCHANCYIKNKVFNKKAHIQCMWDQMLFKEAYIIGEILLVNQNQSFLTDLNSYQQILC